MKRILTLLVVMALMITTLPTAFANEPTTIHIMFPASQIVDDDNLIFNLIEEKLGFNFKTTQVSYDDYANKLSALIAANDLPDIFLVQKNVLRELATYDKISPLDELLNNYGKDIIADKSDLYMPWNSYNGQVYGVYLVGMAMYSTTVMRKDYLDTLGLQVPTTLEEFYTALKAITETDPDGNGLPNIGMSGSLVSVYGAFGIPENRNIYLDGQVVPFFMHPNFIEAITLINQMYREGIYDNEYATLDTLSEFGRLWDGTYGAYNFQCAGPTQNWLWRYTKEGFTTDDLVYVLIRGENGQGGYLYYDRSNSWIAVINKDSQHKEEAMKLLNYCVTEEGTTLAELGIEGRHFKWTDKENYQYEKLEPYASDSTLTYTEGAVLGNFMSAQNNIISRGYNDLTKEGLRIAAENILDEATLYSLTEFDSTSDKAVIDDLVTEMINQLMVCNQNEIEPLYQSYLEMWLTSGGQTWIEQATEIYKAQEGID